MKYLLIFIAVSFAACKDCAVCVYSIHNDSGEIIAGEYSQENELKCEMSTSEYEEQKATELETDVNFYNSIPVIEFDEQTQSFETTYDNSHYYELDCN